MRGSLSPPEDELPGAFVSARVDTSDKAGAAFKCQPPENSDREGVIWFRNDLASSVGSRAHKVKAKSVRSTTTR